MSFDNLPAQAPIHPPEAEEYSLRALDLSREAAAKCDCYFDIKYGEDYYQSIDIYRPVNEHDRVLPVLLFAHGGAWTNGYKEWMGLLAPSITSFPAIYISVSHRLAPEYRYPVPFDDCLAALAWVYKNIDRYNGDPNRLFVGGHSSGGHLYALCTLRRELWESAGLPDHPVTACFPVSARFNMIFYNPEPGTVEYRHQSMLFTPGEDTVQASPIHQLKGNRVPFLLAYGSRDLSSIIENNEQMMMALEENDCPVHRVVLDDYDHFDTALEIRHPDTAWMMTVRAWMVDSIVPGLAKTSKTESHHT